MGEFNGDDFDLEVNEDGVLIERPKPGREPEDMVTISFVVTGFTLGSIDAAGEPVFVIDFTSSDGDLFQFAITPELTKTLVLGLVDALEREWT